jgi:hypothetical protein
MKVFVAWAVPAAFVLAACGGKVVLDGASGTGVGGAGVGGAGVGGAGVGGGFSGGGAGFAGGSVGTSGTGGGTTDCVPTCAEALANGGMPCGGNAASNYQSLLVCAGCSDTGNCEGVCGASLCESLGSSSGCTGCLQAGCATELFDCEQS